MLPAAIAERLKFRRGSLAERHSAVTVLFADIVGFTPMAERVSPSELFVLLDEIFTSFDALVIDRDVEKIKTIGDNYMVAAGVPDGRVDHASVVADLALAMQAAIGDIAARRGLELSIRIGFHSGPAVAGVIGQNKFAYDLWGDTVNTASRMESAGAAGRIQITNETRLLLDDRFVVEPRGEIAVKGKGTRATFWLVGAAAT